MQIYKQTKKKKKKRKRIRKAKTEYLHCHLIIGFRHLEMMLADVLVDHFSGRLLIVAGLAFAWMLTILQLGVT